MSWAADERGVAMLTWLHRPGPHWWLSELWSESTGYACAAWSCYVEATAFVSVQRIGEPPRDLELYRFMRSAPIE